MILLQSQPNPMNSIFMILALIVIFYFFMIRPQQKRQKEIRKFRESLAAGSKIVTAGGIHGTIKDVKENYFIVEVADGVRLRRLPRSKQACGGGIRPPQST